MKNLSRRGFISSSATVLGAGISFGILTSCGEGSTSNQDSQSDFPDDLQLVQRFPQVLVPGNLRLPISLALSSGITVARYCFCAFAQRWFCAFA
ncbi:MAG: hypothetical protein RLZZ105_883 [Actinomycetota bacterium]